MRRTNSQLMKFIDGSFVSHFEVDSAQKHRRLKNNNNNRTNRNSRPQEAKRAEQQVDGRNPNPGRLKRLPVTSGWLRKPFYGCKNKQFNLETNKTDN